MTLGSGILWRIRGLISRLRQAVGAARQHCTAVVLVADELAVTVIRHGGGCAWLRLWRSGQLLCC
jgi:hypothetical protein